MSGIKDYTVRYNIVTDISKSIDGLKKISKIASDFEKPMQALSTAIATVAQQANKLKQDTDIKFSATIDTSLFKTQLDSMVDYVEKASEKIHRALYSALTNNKPVSNIISKSADDAIKKAENEIFNKNKKINGLVLDRQDVNRSIRLAKNAEDKKILEAKRDEINKNLKVLRAEVKELESLQNGFDKSTGSTISADKSNNHPSKKSNVTPKLIKEWKAAFGDSRNKAMSVRITGNAGGKNGALTVITDIQKKLNALQASAEKPFSVDVRGILKSIEPTAKPPVVPIVGELTKIQQQAVQTIPVNVRILSDQLDASTQSKGKGKGKDNKGVFTLTAKIDESGIAKQIKAMPKYNLPLYAKISWEKGIIGKQAQLKQIATSIPDIKIDLDISSAIAKLEEFVSLVKLKSPQTIALNATGNASQAAQSTSQPSVTTSSNNKGGTARQNKNSNKDSIDGHKKKADKLYNQAYNTMLPYASTKEQASVLAKHRKFFKKASITSGYTPTSDMDNISKLQYLNEVASHMKSASVQVPWAIQSQINKLQSSIDKENGIGVSKSKGSVGGNAYKRPFYERTRKWAYPFTGTTSFGERTPMAVEMAQGMGIGYAIGGAMGEISNAFSQAVDYQNIIKTTQSILKTGTDSYSHDAFKNMEYTVRNVGIKTKFSAPEVASAANFLAMTGYDIDAINSSIKPIANLALIGDSDLGETADKMTNIMTTFGIKPENMRAASNIMATTAMRSNTDIMMLAESAKYGGGVAKMYGGNDPNLFADTMAIFGVMGNAGIQASSAGTGLRMMYQNLFKPNRNQKKTLEMMEKEYGINTLNENGGYRSMADILIDMANKIPENKIAEIVGNLFRITAQPGASAVLMAAQNGDKDAQEQVAVGEFLAKSLGNKGGLSALAELMQANRKSVRGNIAENIANEKQNTIKGLWAQVTSTFTEGILRALESRMGEFTSILNNLKDYLAKPETMNMLRSLIDMIVDVGKSMAWFAEIWVKIYQAAPGVITTWIKLQMFFTQFGTLISPVTQLIGAFSRLRDLMLAIAGLKGTSAAGAAASAGSELAELAVGGALGGTISDSGSDNTQYFNEKIRDRVNKAYAKNAIEADKKAALTGGSRDDILNDLNDKTTKHYSAVQQKYNNMYYKGTWSKISRSFSTGLEVANTITLVSIFSQLKSTVVSLLAGLAAKIGMLINPVTLAITAISGLGFAIYRFCQRMNGNTASQIEAQQKLAEASERATRSIIQNQAWYEKELAKFQKPVSVNGEGKSKTQIAFEENQERFKEENTDLRIDLTKDISKKLIDEHAAAYQKKMDNPRIRLALGNQFDDLAGKNLTNTPRIYEPSTYGSGYQALRNNNTNLLLQAQDIRKKQFKAALMVSMLNDPKIKEAELKITELRSRNMSIVEYNREVDKIINSVTRRFDPSLISGANLTQEQFNNIEDYSIYKESHEGAYNYLRAVADSAPAGTIAGIELARSRVKSGYTKPFTNEWYDEINKLLPSYPVDFFNENGQAKFALSMLPNGVIDHNAIIKQLKDNKLIENPTLNDFANIFASTYNSIAEDGYAPNTKDGLRTFLKKNISNLPVTHNDAVSYFHNALPQDDKIRSVCRTPEEFAKFVTEHNGVKKIGEELVGASRYRVNIRNAAINKGVDELINKSNDKLGRIDKTTHEIKDILTDGKVKDEKDKNNPTSKIPEAINQDPYASGYNKGKVRPTHITININELVHFNGTKIEANASEQEIMNSIESKITNAVFDIFASASNMAQKSFDLTDLHGMM